MNIKMTLEEAIMVQDMDGAIREGWLNTTAPTFTARALAMAVENTVGQGVNVERKLRRCWTAWVFLWTGGHSVETPRRC